MTIGRASNLDYRSVARLHSENITEGFLSTLGNSFLANIYHGVNQSPRSGVLVATEQGQVLGFASYTADLSRCYRHVLARRFVPLVIACVPSMFRPEIYKKCLETLLYPWRSAKAEPRRDVPKHPRAELLSIVVGEAARGRRLGKKLIAEVDRCLAELGIKEYYVVTHGIDERSNSFYVSAGFQAVVSFVNHGKPMTEYRKVIGDR
jgi:GNAT superfamily N-acetyltransferase